jgi:murein DD-endopeptidase MepM/ murein hydrolase activator NlpD
MVTFKSEDKEYRDYFNGNVVPATTRGLVVSTVDPLFAGRVKVWIPAIHGGNPYMRDGDNESQDVVPPAAKALGVFDAGDFKSEDVNNYLPWAIVMGGNSGPIQDINNPAINYSAGCFSTPSVGTEVIIIFENNNPALPVIVGSIIHANEFRYSLSRNLEYVPGISLTSVLKQTENKDIKSEAEQTSTDDYNNLVSSVYNIKTKGGSTLYLSDDIENKAIVLEGATPFSQQSFLTTEEAVKLDSVYPPFPTTASAAFAKRQTLLRQPLSPLIAPTAAVGGDVVVSATTTTTTDTNLPPANTEAIKKDINRQAASTQYKKSWPVSGPPRLSQGLGLFSVQRPANLGGKVHTGIDIGANADGSTLLLAPIDCYPVFVKVSRDPGIGVMLLAVGLDGFAHAFLHCRSIYPAITKMIQSGNISLVKAGTPMGVCGITTTSSHNTGPHLHWEVFPSNNIFDGPKLAAYREVLRKKEPVPSGMINPNDWIKGSADGTSVSTMVATSEEQIRSAIAYATLHSDSSENDYAKPVGLSMCLVPGKESVVIRHPSGSYIGFDPDGNIQIYSSGDINFRVNRSLHFDVLGGILETCYAKFSRVKTVIKTWAKVFGPDGTNPSKADDTMPEFFSRAEKTRAIDMTNALSSTMGNSFVLNSDKEIVPLTNISDNKLPTTIAMYKTDAVLEHDKAYDMTKWDKDLTTMYNKYIKSNATALTIFPEIKQFKAIMLHESNGDEKAVSKSGATGLFQLTGVVFEDLKLTLSPQERQAYFNGTKNMDLAFQYFIKLISYVRDAITSAGYDPSTINRKDFMYMVMISYNQGPTATRRAIREVKNAGNPLTYLEVERLGKLKNIFKYEGLIYVPTIELIKSKTSAVSA